MAAGIHLLNVTIETVEQGVKYVQSLKKRHQNDATDIAFHTLFYCFYC